MQNVNCKLQNYLKRLILILSSSVCAVFLLSLHLSVFAQEDNKKRFAPVNGFVLADRVNIRARQGLNFEVLGQLNKSEKVLVLDEQSGWYKIRLPRKALCFVHQDYIDKDVVKVNKLRVRAGAGINFNILCNLKRGEKVDIVEQKGEWLRIVPTGNCAGWVKKDYLGFTKKDFSAQENRDATEKKIEAWGVIDDLGKIINRQGTHKLVNEKKVLYYLKSEALNLNHYVYQKVCIKGFLENLENSPYPVITVEQIKVGQ